MDSAKTTLAEDVYKALMENKTEEEKHNKTKEEKDNKTEKEKHEYEWDLTKEPCVPNIVLQIQTQPMPNMYDNNEIMMRSHNPKMEEKPMQSVVQVDDIPTMMQESDMTTSDSSSESEVEEDPEGVSDLNCCQVWGNNWRQFTSVLPGIILLLSCAMQFSWAVRQLDLKGVQTKFFRDMGRYNQSSEQNYTVYEYSYNSRNIDLLNIVSWYIGAAVGNIFAAMLVPSFKKASIYFISGLLLAGSAILLLFGKHYAIGGRGLFGFVSGILQLTVMVHVSDIASKEMRSNIIRKIVYMLVLTSFIWSLVMPKFESADQILNSLTAMVLLALSVIGLVLTPILTTETVPYLLLHGKDSKALKTLTKLRSEKKPSWITRRCFEELKVLVKEDRLMGWNVLGGGNFKALFTILNGRLMNLLLRNVPLTLMILNVCTNVPLLNSLSNDSSTLFARYETLHLILGVLALGLTSWCGLRLIHFLVLGLSGFIIGSMFNLVRGNIVSIVVVLMTAFVSMGANVSDWVHTVQAFSIVKKPWSMALVTFIEHAVHITIIAMYCTSNTTPMCWLIFSVGSFMFATMLLILLPKSTKLSLRNARNKYNKTPKRKFEAMKNC